MLPQIVYLGSAVVVGMLGRNRKLGFWGYAFGSLLFTPFVGMVLVFCSDRRS